MPKWFRRQILLENGTEFKYVPKNLLARSNQGKRTATEVSYSSGTVLSCYRGTVCTIVISCSHRRSVNYTVIILSYTSQIEMSWVFIYLLISGARKGGRFTLTLNVRTIRVSIAAACLLVSLYLISLSYLLWFVDFEPRFRQGGSVRTNLLPSYTCPSFLWRCALVCLFDSFSIFMFSTSVPLFQRGRHR